MTVAWQKNNQIYFCDHLKDPGHQQLNLIPHFCPSMWFVTEVTKPCSSMSTFKLPLFPQISNRNHPRTAWHFLLVHHSQISWGKRSPLLFLFDPRARENDPVSSHTRTHLHTGCRHSHTSHTCCPWAKGEGLRGAWPAELALSQMGHFVAYMRGKQKAAGLLCRVDAQITIETVNTHTWSQSLVAHSFKAQWPGCAADVQVTINVKQLQDAPAQFGKCIISIAQYTNMLWYTTILYSATSSYRYFRPNIHSKHIFSSTAAIHQQCLLCVLYWCQLHTAVCVNVLWTNMTIITLHSLSISFNCGYTGFPHNNVMKTISAVHTHVQDSTETWQYTHLLMSPLSDSSLSRPLFASSHVRIRGTSSSDSMLADK